MAAVNYTYETDCFDLKEERLDDLAAEYLKQSIKSMLRPFAQELQAQGVIPHISIDSDREKVNLEVRGADEQLVERIRKALLDF